MGDIEKLITRHFSLSFKQFDTNSYYFIALCSIIAVGKYFSGHFDTNLFNFIVLCSNNAVENYFPDD